MRHRAFIINSVVLVLLIPLLLLLATYEDTSNYITYAQSSRIRTETLYRGIDSIELDLQTASEISMKRAVLSVLQYVTAGNSISKANESIMHLMIEGQYLGISMPFNETLESWYVNTERKLKLLGFTLTLPPGTSFKDDVEITVAQIDAFHIVAEVRIKNITIAESSGKIVYQGPLPRQGAVYAIMSIEGLEDPIFPYKTGGQLYRIIVPAPYHQYIKEPLIESLNGQGVSIQPSNLKAKGYVKFYDSDSGNIGVSDKYSNMGGYSGEGFVFKTLDADIEDLTRNSQVIGKPIVYNTSISPLEWTNENDIGVVVINGSIHEEIIPGYGKINILQGDGRFYDLYPLSEAISSGYYFGVYINDSVSCNPPSFFDRLEQNLCLTPSYFDKSKELQLKLGLTDGTFYYPIGLVSFIDPAYIWKNYPVLRDAIEDKVTKNQSCADYQFFSDDVIPGKLIYGLDLAEWYDESLPFRLSDELAQVFFGEQGYHDLIQG